MSLKDEAVLCDRSAVQSSERVSFSFSVTEYSVDLLEMGSSTCVSRVQLAKRVGVDAPSETLASLCLQT